MTVTSVDFLAWLSRYMQVCTQPGWDEKYLCAISSASKLGGYEVMPQKKHAYNKLKATLSSSPVLVPRRETATAADVSIQLQCVSEKGLRLVANISRAMPPTETRYAQIDKETTALIWTCKGFSDYLLWLKFHIFTDHKPLAPLLGLKCLKELSLRVQWFTWDLSVFISPYRTSQLITINALSWGLLSAKECKLEREVSTFVSLVMNSLPATETRLREIRLQQEKDEVCCQIKTYCNTDWPERKFIPGPVKPHLSFASQLSTSVVDGTTLARQQNSYPTIYNWDPRAPLLGSPRHQQGPTPS